MGQEQQDRQTTWAREHSLDMLEDWQTCPMRVAGKQCHVVSNSSVKRQFGELWLQCVCQHPAVRALKDHERVWSYLKTGKPRVIVHTYEPYSASPEQVNALREVVQELGILIWETGESAWEDGTNILVLARAEVTAEDLGL